MRPLTDRLKSSAIWNFNVVQRDRWVARIASTIPAGSRVLDVGAGSTPYRKYFDHVEYVTQDLCPLPPDQLRGKEGYGQIDLISSADDIPVPDAGFDYVVCFEMLEHVPNPVDVVTEIARVLKPGGTLFLTAPLGSGLHQAPHHFYGGYTEFWYRRFLPPLGFSTIEVEPNGGFFKHFAQESIRFSTLTAPWMVRRGLATRVLVGLVWLVTLPIFAFLVPLLGAVLDAVDDERDLTVGYHVTARKDRG